MATGDKFNDRKWKDYYNIEDDEPIFGDFEVGTVVGVGQTVDEIAVGDTVQYTDHCLPVPMKHNNEDHLLIQEGDIFAILRDV